MGNYQVYRTNGTIIEKRKVKSIMLIEYYRADNTNGTKTMCAQMNLMKATKKTDKEHGKIILM